MNKKSLFVFLLTLVIMFLILFPFYLPDCVIYKVKEISIYNYGWDSWATVTFTIIISLSTYGANKLSVIIYDFFFKN